MTEPTETIQVPAAPDSAERAAHVFEAAAAWLFNDTMAGLFAEFGEKIRSDDGDPLGLDDPPTRLVTGSEEPDGPLTEGQTAIVRMAVALERLSARHFDFRAGRAILASAFK